MHIFNIKNVNGAQLAKELGIAYDDVWVDEEKVYINTSKEFDEVKMVFDLHKPVSVINYRASALAKLAALGLTEDEIAAL